MNKIELLGQVNIVTVPHKRGRKLFTEMYIIYPGRCFNREGKQEKYTMVVIVEVYGLIGKKLYSDFLDQKIKSVLITGYLIDRVRENIPVIVAENIKILK